MARCSRSKAIRLRKVRNDRRPDIDEQVTDLPRARRTQQHAGWEW